MTDIFTKAKRSEVMSRIRGSGNRDTELRLMGLFREHGFTGWRRKARVFGKPDFVFPKARVAHTGFFFLCGKMRFADGDSWS